MSDLFFTLMNEFGIDTLGSDLTVNHIVLIFAFVIALGFVSDIVYILFKFCSDLRK